MQTDPLPAGNYVATANAAVSSSAETALCWFDPVSTGGNTDDGWTMSFGTTTTETTATLSLWDRFPSIAANDSIGLYCDNTGGVRIDDLHQPHHHGDAGQQHRR